jgi:hypothetical protein
MPTSHGSVDHDRSASTAGCQATRAWPTEARSGSSRSGGNARLVSASRVQLGTLAVLRGEPKEARALLDEALDRGVSVRSTRDVTLCLSAFAWLAFRDGDPERAALLMGAAEGLRRRAGLRAWPAMRSGSDEPITQVRRALGAGRFGQLFAAGAELNQRQAVAAVHH